MDQQGHSARDRMLVSMGNRALISTGNKVLVSSGHRVLVSADEISTLAGAMPSLEEHQRMSTTEQLLLEPEE